jgi:hypothetical protein
MKEKQCGPSKGEGSADVVDSYISTCVSPGRHSGPATGLERAVHSGARNARRSQMLALCLQFSCDSRRMPRKRFRASCNEIGLVHATAQAWRALTLRRPLPFPPMVDEDLRRSWRYEATERYGRGRACFSSPALFLGGRSAASIFREPNATITKRCWFLDQEKCQ